jgi:hypothetical protein
MSESPHLEAASVNQSLIETGGDTTVLQLPAPATSPDGGTPRRPSTPKAPGVRFARVMFTLILLLNVIGAGGVWAARTVAVAQHTLVDLRGHLAHIEAKTANLTSMQLTTLQEIQVELGQVNSDLQTLDGLIPLNGRVDVGGAGAAHRVLRLGIDALTGVREGITIATILQPASQGLIYSLTHSPAELQAHGDHLLTLDDVHQAQRHLAVAKEAWARVLQDRQAITPKDLQALHQAQLTRLIQKLDGLAPTVATGFDLASAVVDWLPRVLGLSGPIHFLLLDLDSDELRATGGFQGNYADLTVTNGALTSGVHLHDVYTLDCPNKVCPPRDVPAEFSWFTIGGGHFGLRDTNLNPDFPTSAALASQYYQLESGHAVDAVITITPTVIEGIMRTVGPLQVAGFGVRVTADNLRNLLHYYHQNPQIAEQLGISPTALGTSIAKVFDVLVAQALFAKLSALTSAQQVALGKTLLGYLNTKDIQVFVSNSRVERILSQLHMAGTVITSKGDSEFVVDTNDGGSYANADMRETISDEITLDAKGGAAHNLTVTHTFATVQHNYAQTGTYEDLVRVIVPRSATGLTIRGPCTPVQVVQTDHLALACQFSLDRGATSTLSFSWYVPNVAPTQNGGTYQLLVQRQAGASDDVHVKVLPAPGASLGLVAGPGTMESEAYSWSATPLTNDTSLAARVTNGMHH